MSASRTEDCPADAWVNECLAQAKAAGIETCIVVARWPKGGQWWSHGGSRGSLKAEFSTILSAVEALLSRAPWMAPLMLRAVGIAVRDSAREVEELRQ